MTKNENNSTPVSGVMFKFSYRENPRTNPAGMFDVIRFFAGTDHTLIKHNASYHANKTGAVAVTAITPQQYQELLNEETKQSKTEIVTEEAHQA